MAFYAIRKIPTESQALLDIILHVQEGLHNDCAKCSRRCRAAVPYACLTERGAGQTCVCGSVLFAVTAL